MKNRDYKALRTTQQKQEASREQLEAMQATSEIINSQVNALAELQAGMKKMIAGIEAINAAMPGTVNADTLDDMKRQSEQNDTIVASFKQASEGMSDALKAVDTAKSMGVDNGR